MKSAHTPTLLPSVLTATLPASILGVLLWADWLPPRVDWFAQPTSIGTLIVMLAVVMTLVGCTASVFLFRNSIHAVPWWMLTLASLLVAILLRVMFETVPDWPIGGAVLLVAWGTLAATLNGLALAAVAWWSKQAES